MPRRLLATAFALVLLAAACGGGGDDDEGAAADTTASDGAATDDDGGATDDGGDDGGSSGDIDCAAIDDATEGLGLAVQILAQLRTLDQYALVKDGTLTFDAAATLEDVEALRALEGIEIPAAYGTVEEALDTYEEAATLAQANLAVDDPFTDAQGDELVALTADVGEFLSGQVAIGFALDGTDC